MIFNPGGHTRGLLNRAGGFVGVLSSHVFKELKKFRKNIYIRL